MQIYFGRTDVNDTGCEMFVAKDLLGEECNYWYSVEYGSNPGGLEEIHIRDTCDRYVPIAIDHIPDLIIALQDMLQVSESVAIAQREIDDVLDKENIVLL